MNRFLINIRRAAVGAALCFSFAGIQAQVSFGKPEKFNEGWLFNLNDIKEASQPEYADST